MDGDDDDEPEEGESSPADGRASALPARVRDGVKLAGVWLSKPGESGRAMGASG